MQRIHLFLHETDSPSLWITLETVEPDGSIEDSVTIDKYQHDEISSAIDEAWNEARNRGLPLLISADVVNLPG